MKIEINSASVEWKFFSVNIYTSRRSAVFLLNHLRASHSVVNINSATLFVHMTVDLSFLFHAFLSQLRWENLH